MKQFISRVKTYLAVLLTALIIIAGVLISGSRPVSNDKRPMRVVIVQGASARDAVAVLKKKRLIRSSFVFLLALRISGSSEKLKPGVYEVSPSMGASEIINHIVNGDTLESWVTIPEGKTLREIADTLKTKQLADDDAFLQMTTSQGSDFPSYSFIDGENLEGYLFPDTYLIARGTDTDSIISKMLDAFDSKVVTPNRMEIEHVIKVRFGLGEDQFPEGLHKILTMASLVEREAKTQKDRPLIAAVIWNRLKKNMRLEIDASASYVLGESRENKKRLLYKDLDNDSPYNTYRHSGLPPAPICNPGLASIKAVLEPASVDYLYYVAKTDGSHVFSRTLEEHDAAKNKIQNGKL